MGKPDVDLDWVRTMSAELPMVGGRRHLEVPDVSVEQMEAMGDRELTEWTTMAALQTVRVALAERLIQMTQDAANALIQLAILPPLLYACMLGDRATRFLSGLALILALMVWIGTLLYRARRLADALDGNECKVTPLTFWSYPSTWLWIAGAAAWMIFLGTFLRDVAIELGVYFLGR